MMLYIYLYPFIPELHLEESTLEVVQETTTNNCRWDANTKHNVAKGNSRLWFLRSLKLLGASQETLLDINKLFCRPIREYGSTVCRTGIFRILKEFIRMLTE